MNVVFVDWTPINSKSDICRGIQIRRYYAWITLNKMVNKVIPFRKENGSINRKAVIRMFKKDSVLWLEYGCGGVASLFVLFASIISSNKLILNLHDLVTQQRYIDKEVRPFLKRIRLQIIEHLLLKHADVMILPCPGLLDFFRHKKSQKILIMPPGVGEDELFVPQTNKMDNGKKIAIYFGSMKRKDAIPKIIELFSELKEWELHLIGHKEGEEIIEKKNVKYLGSVTHDKLADILSTADTILIPLPKNEYLDIAMPTKFVYALKSCRPVIVTKLKGISEHVSLMGLEENVIYGEEWDIDSLKEALNKALKLNIDAEKTIERLRPMAWEPRFRKVVEIALDTSQTIHDRIEWV
jgi:glycosyltransferase involved in cell wall biosynthesis